MRVIIGGIVILMLLGLAVPIWLAVMSVLDLTMPWLVIGLVGWAAYSLLHGPRERRWSRRVENRWSRQSWQSRPAPISRPPFATQPRPQPRPETRPPSPKPEPRPELPIGVQVKVEQIRRKVEVLLGYASRFPPFSKDLYIVRQTASDYLPRTIDAYLALPAGDGVRIVTANGKTALQELSEQLGLLDSKLDEIAEDLQRQDLDRLLANRQFLEERFGSLSA